MNAVTDCMAMIADIAGTIAKPQTIFEACVEAARPFNADDIESTGKRMRLLCDMESEQEEKAPELDVADMNDAELRACILHDPDMVTRRRALARFGALRYSEGCADQAKAARGVRS